MPAPSGRTVLRLAGLDPLLQASLPDPYGRELHDLPGHRGPVAARGGVARSHRHGGIRAVEWCPCFLRAEPPGSLQAGQVLHLAPDGFGGRMRVIFEIQAVKPMESLRLLARLPLGVTNQEHITLTEAAPGATLVRFN